MPVSKTNRFLGLAFLAALAWLALSRSQVQAQTSPGDQESLGARLYVENCAVCHGANGEGRIGATLAKDWPSIRPDLTVKTIIANGVPGSAMTAWSQERGGPLSDDEIDAIMTFILSWQTGGAPQITERPTATSRPPITPIPDVEGDPNQGAVLYDQNCAMCHGSNGEGRVGATLAKDWAGIRPDLQVKTTIQIGIPNTAMPAWSQAKGGPLSDAQVNDLTAYILTWEGSPLVVQISPTVISPIKEGPSPLSGWWGPVAGLAFFIIIVAAALILQRKHD